MTVMAIPHSRRRILLIAAVAFFFASAYLCATRLFAMSFTRESITHATSPVTVEPDNNVGGQTDDKTTAKTDEKESEKTSHEADKTPDEKKVEVKIGPADMPMSYGGYNRPNMDDIHLMATLPVEHVPSATNGKRLIVVGDIHGMIDPLKALLDEVKFNPDTDHLVAAGDMVNKGPDSPGVIAHLMKLKASAVRGNHEDRVLLTFAEFQGLEGLSANLSDAESEKHRGEAEHLTVARALKPEHLEWLSHLPVILDAKSLSIAVVHAGLVPGIKLEKQDPWAVMNMRTLIYPREELRAAEKKKAEKEKEEKEKKEKEKTEKDKGRRDERKAEDAQASRQQDDQLETDEPLQDNPFDSRSVAVPTETHNGEDWADAWNRRQGREKKRHQRTVIYGHDAKRGFKEGKHTVGLDSGCVTGGKLTAVVIEGHEDGFKRSISSVNCEKP